MPACILLLLFFCRLIQRSKRLDGAPPARLPSGTFILRPPVFVLIVVSNHKTPLLSLYFLLGYVFAPQAKEQPAMSVNLSQGACNGLTGILSSSALIWGYGGCCHGNRREFRWREGWWRLMLFFVCVMFCVFCCVCLRKYSIMFYFLANQLVNINRDKGQISKLCGAVNKKPQQKHTDILCAKVEWFIHVA